MSPRAEPDCRMRAAFGTLAQNIMSKVLGVEGEGKTGGAAHYLSGLDSRIGCGMGEDDSLWKGKHTRLP